MLAIWILLAIVFLIMIAEEGDLDQPENPAK